MNFKRFLQLHEIADFAMKDTSRVNLQAKHDTRLVYNFDYDCRRDNPGDYAAAQRCVQEKLSKVEPSDYWGEFEVDGKRFKVHLSPYAENLMSSSVAQALGDLGASSDEIKGYFKNVFYLAFEGPAGYSTTNAMKGATEIYTNLLLTVKKLSEQRQVDGLVFTPYEEGMGLVYARFIKNFTDFQIIDDGYGLYLSKKVIDQIIQRHPAFGKLVQQTGEKQAEKLKSARQNKVVNRTGANIARNLIGKMLVFETHFGKRVGLAYGYEHGWLHLYYMSNYGIDYNSARMENLWRIRDFPHLQDEVEELRQEIEKARQEGSFSRNRALTQVVGDHQPYDGPLPSDAGQESQQQQPDSSTTRGWGSV